MSDRGTTIEQLRRKADQHWELAGLARLDRDFADEARHMRLARELERKIREMKVFGEAECDRVAELERERNQLLDKLHCMCGSPIDHSAWEGHTPVSVYDYSLDQERSRAEAAEARLAEARRLIRSTHKRAVTHTNCEDEFCAICVGGLFICADCGAVEAEAEERICTGGKEHP